MHNDKDLSTWQTFRRLWPVIAPFKTGLIVAGVALILNAASDTYMLSLLKPLLDDGFGKTDRSVLLWMPLVVIGLMVLRGITSYISSYCISWVSGKVVMTMRRRLFNHMMGMPSLSLINNLLVRCSPVLPTIPSRSLHPLPAR